MQHSPFPEYAIAKAGEINSMARQPKRGCPCRPKSPKGYRKMPILHWHGCTLHFIEATKSNRDSHAA